MSAFLVAAASPSRARPSVARAAAAVSRRVGVAAAARSAVAAHRIASAIGASYLSKGLRVDTVHVQRIGSVTPYRIGYIYSRTVMTKSVFLLLFERANERPLCIEV